MAPTLVLVRVRPDAYAAIQTSPEQLEVILEAEGVAREDVSDRNYDALCEQFGSAGVFDDLGVDGKLGYQAPHGPAFSISPESAKRASDSSKLLADDAALRAWVTTAAARGSYIVGVVV